MSAALILIVDKKIPQTILDKRLEIPHSFAGLYGYDDSLTCELYMHEAFDLLDNGYEIEGYSYVIWRDCGRLFYVDAAGKEDKAPLKWIYDLIIELIIHSYKVKLINGDMHEPKLLGIKDYRTLKVDLLKDINTILVDDYMYTVEY